MQKDSDIEDITYIKHTKLIEYKQEPYNLLKTTNCFIVMLLLCTRF